jgi:hypothetical protein
MEASYNVTNKVRSFYHYLIAILLAALGK